MNVITSLNNLFYFVCLYTPVSLYVPEMDGIYATGGHSFEGMRDTPSVGFRYPVSTGMPGGVTVGDSGPCCCVPCLMNASILPFVFWSLVTQS